VNLDVNNLSSASRLVGVVVLTVETRLVRGLVMVIATQAVGMEKRQPGS